MPEDFSQDYSATTSTSIGLTWSYPAGKNVGEFVIYRYYDFPEGNGSYELDSIKASDYTSVTYDENGRPVYHYEYIDDEGLSPYTEYLYQIQAVRSAVPPCSILSAPLAARTKPDRGIPTVMLDGVDKNLIPEYDDDGNLIGTRPEYTLMVYPDTAKTVSVLVEGDSIKQSKYQWQKKGDDGWSDIRGATLAKYQFVNSGHGDEAEYRCQDGFSYPEISPQPTFLCSGRYGNFPDHRSGLRPNLRCAACQQHGRLHVHGNSEPCLHG